MEKTESAAKKSGSGCGAVAIIIILVVIIAAVFGVDRAIKSLNSLDEVKLTDEQQATVVTAAGNYNFKDNTVTITADIPLSGGPMNGTVSGACDGELVGNYNDTNGSITGKMAGTCSPFFVPIPASAEFSGSVNKESKRVIFNFSGNGGGMKHEGSTTLTY